MFKAFVDRAAALFSWAEANDPVGGPDTDGRTSEELIQAQLLAQYLDEASSEPRHPSAARKVGGSQPKTPATPKRQPAKTTPGTPSHVQTYTSIELEHSTSSPTKPLAAKASGSAGAGTGTDDENPFLKPVDGFPDRFNNFVRNQYSKEHPFRRGLDEHDWILDTGLDAWDLLESDITHGSVAGGWPTQPFMPPPPFSLPMTPMNPPRRRRVTPPTPTLPGKSSAAPGRPMRTPSIATEDVPAPLTIPTSVGVVDDTVTFSANAEGTTSTDQWSTYRPQTPRSTPKHVDLLMASPESPGPDSTWTAPTAERRAEAGTNRPVPQDPYPPSTRGGRRTALIPSEAQCIKASTARHSAADTPAETGRESKETGTTQAGSPPSGGPRDWRWRNRVLDAGSFRDESDSDSTGLLARPLRPLPAAMDGTDHEGQNSVRLPNSILRKRPRDPEDAAGASESKRVRWAGA